jgi:hypothetical protein
MGARDCARTCTSMAPMRSEYIGRPSRSWHGMNETYAPPCRHCSRQQMPRMHLTSCARHNMPCILEFGASATPSRRARARCGYLIVLGQLIRLTTERRSCTGRRPLPRIVRGIPTNQSIVSAPRL